MREDWFISQTRNASDIVQPIHYGVCKEMLRKPIGNSSVTYWNLALLTPNMLFLIFLAYRVGLFYKFFQQLNFPVVKTLLVLVFFVCLVNIVRGFTATFTQIHKRYESSVANEVLWLFLRFLVLAVEISVVGFGLFGNSPGSGVGKRVVSLSFFLALVYAASQSIFEYYTPNRPKIFKNKYMMFHHGGMLFWFVTSCIFVVIYSCIVILPTAKNFCCRFLARPSNRTFYSYAAVMCVINLLEALGSALVYYKHPYGLCILNGSVLILYSLFGPFIYLMFLRKSFRALAASDHSINDEEVRYTTTEDITSLGGDLNSTVVI